MSSPMFTLLEGDAAIIADKGVYRVAPLYEFRGGIYARHGTGYVRLYGNGTTSKGNGVRVVELHTDIVIAQDSFGRMVTQEARPDAAPLALPKMEG